MDVAHCLQMCARVLYRRILVLPHKGISPETSEAHRHFNGITFGSPKPVRCLHGILTFLFLFFLWDKLIFCMFVLHISQKECWLRLMVSATLVVWYS